MAAFKLTHWLAAARLRTLPLACAVTLCGALFAKQYHVYQPSVFWLSIATAIALQIFSNFANDYGDALHGADHDRSQAPMRMVAAGKISPTAMRIALVLHALVCCLLGIALLNAAASQHWGIWLLLGASALVAAYTYTAGNKPYGYAGLGDLAVFVFFGWLGVAGSATLHSGQFQLLVLLPASALGCWCVMVLNLNNMRDRISDQQAGKRTLAVRLGARAAQHYHALLAGIALLCWLGFLGQHFAPHIFWLSGLLLALTSQHIIAVYRTPTAAAFDRLLPQWSGTILLWVCLLWWV